MISNFRAGTIIKMSTLSLSRLWLFQLGSLARVNTVKLPSRGKTRIYRRLWVTASASVQPKLLPGRWLPVRRHLSTHILLVPSLATRFLPASLFSGATKLTILL